MKNVFIVGARGYHSNYGGWETFVSNLVDNYNDTDTKFYISSLTTNKEDKDYWVNDNIYVNQVYIGMKSSARMFFYAIKAFRNCVTYIKKNKLENCYIYVLGLRLGPYLNIIRRKLNKLKIKVLVNPDGLEWMRSKWNYFIKKFFLLSEFCMLHGCDTIICDAKGIKKYVDNKYPKLKDKTIYIAYGTNKVEINSNMEKEVLSEYSLAKNKYCLMVGRCVPENNYELVIKEFMKSKIKKDLVIISNLSSSNYYDNLVKITGCDKDKRIHFIDGVYDQEKLAIIRKYAFLYIHGHSVGGTNPGLLEALSITDLNILYDINFNKDVGLDSCLYFKEEGSLTKLLDKEDYLKDNKKKLGKLAKEIINKNFTWDIIVSKYKKVFK